MPCITQRWLGPRAVGGALAAIVTSWGTVCVAGALRDSPPAVGALATGRSAAPGGGAAVEQPTAPEAGAAPAAPQYVRDAVCAIPACHGAVAAEYGRLLHTHYVARSGLEGAGCQTCHGPGSEHVADSAHGKIGRFTVQSRQNARLINDACMRCHREAVREIHYQTTEHARAGLSCASCHEVHYDLKTPYLLRYPGVEGPAGAPQRERRSRRAPAPAGAPQLTASGALPRLEAAAKARVPIPNWRTSFLREREAISGEQAANELCASCHRGVITELRQFSHHPVFEQRMGCADCHDPHHAPQGRMLKRQTTADTCLQCHQNIRGPYVYEHEPVRVGGIGDQCLECHRPHGSPNRKLHVMFSRGLCIQCHTDIQRDPEHRARPGDCWQSGCHVAIHGSNRSPVFLRE